MTGEFNTLYLDICKTYFPRWMPWAYTYNTGWGAGGYTNADRKHIYFGNPTRDLSMKGLIIHEICHAVGYFNHNTRWQNRMMKAAELAKNHDPKLSAELIDDVQGYQKSPCNQSTEWKMLYQRLEEKFNGLYWKGEPVDEDNIDWVIVRELSEVGVKKEWDEKQFEKMLIKGRKVAKRVEREVRIVKASYEGIRREKSTRPLHFF